RKAAARCANSQADAPLRNPTTGMPGCCALAARGQAAAAPPRRVMNSRRCMAGLLFNYLVGADQQGSRNGEPERPGGLHVDVQLDFRGLLDWQVGGLFALENAAG